MSDQCLHCIKRGDYEECIKTECFFRDSWIVECLKRQKDDVLKNLAYWHTNAEIYKQQRDEAIKKLKEIQKYGFEHPGHGYSCAVKANEFLIDNINQIEEQDKYDQGI